MVTGVQTCALPIFVFNFFSKFGSQHALKLGRECFFKSGLGIGLYGGRRVIALVEDQGKEENCKPDRNCDGEE